MTVYLTESDFRTLFYILILSNMLCLCFAGILGSGYRALLRYLDRRTFAQKGKAVIADFERRAQEMENRQRTRQQR